MWMILNIWLKYSKSSAGIETLNDMWLALGFIVKAL